MESGKKGDRPQVFGGPLTDASLKFIIQLMNRIDPHNVEGIYRISAQRHMIEEIKALVNKGKEPSWEDRDVHTLAGLVKVFFKDMAPQPLFTYYLYNPFLGAIQEEDVAQQRTNVSKLLDQLPYLHFRALGVLMGHLLEVSKLPTCLMDTQNLSIVFGPILLRPPLTETGDPGAETLSLLLDVGHVNRLINYLINNYDIFFQVRLARLDAYLEKVELRRLEEERLFESLGIVSPPKTKPRKATHTRKTVDLSAAHEAHTKQKQQKRITTFRGFFGSPKRTKSRPTIGSIRGSEESGSEICALGSWTKTSMNPQGESLGLAEKLNEEAENPLPLEDVIAHHEAEIQHDSQEALSASYTSLPTIATTEESHYTSPDQIPEETVADDGYDEGATAEEVEDLARLAYGSTRRLAERPRVRPRFDLEDSGSFFVSSESVPLYNNNNNADNTSELNGDHNSSEHSDHITSSISPTVDTSNLTGSNHVHNDTPQASGTVILSPRSRAQAERKSTFGFIPKPLPPRRQPPSVSGPQPMPRNSNNSNNGQIKPRPAPPPRSYPPLYASSPSLRSTPPTNSATSILKPLQPHSQPPIPPSRHRDTPGSERQSPPSPLSASTSPHTTHHNDVSIATSPTSTLIRQVDPSEYQKSQRGKGVALQASHTALNASDQGWILPRSDGLDDDEQKKTRAVRNFLLESCGRLP
eukprot:TRINITY_DN3793_c0_g1_i1.p1 TRINITY_DN3793_c0_g1~~TRINITY_DN3793_c0_g1_i1.p1  ORF type:complete len:696 (+),score=96.63 TRINITY_DN3793_c0_g1_i1:672-2759(+)